jgi:hypothetical protein
MSTALRRVATSIATAFLADAGDDDLGQPFEAAIVRREIRACLSSERADVEIDEANLRFLDARTQRVGSLAIDLFATILVAVEHDVRKWNSTDDRRAAVPSSGILSAVGVVVVET